MYASSLEHWLRDREIAGKPLEEHRSFLLEDYVRKLRPPTSEGLRGASSMSRYISVPWDDSCYKAGLVETLKSGWKEHIPETGRARLSG
jgi:hypothetical protein